MERKPNPPTRLEQNSCALFADPDLVQTASRNSFRSVSSIGLNTTTQSHSKHESQDIFSTLTALAYTRV